MRNTPKNAVEHSPSSDDEEYPLSYLLYVLGTIVVLVLGAIVYLYLVLHRSAAEAGRIARLKC
jgi:hypothetical protein